MFKKYISNITGNVSVVTALCCITVFGAAGVAIDFGRVTAMKAALDDISDAAAIAGAAAIVDFPAATDSKHKSDAESAALKLWNANVTAEQKKAVGVPAITATKTGLDWSVELKYSAKLPTTLTAVLGIAASPFDGRAVVTAGIVKANWDFIFAVDTSSSMAIGATQADMDAMKKDKDIGCMFACHFATGKDSYTYAKQRGYKIRLNIVDEAIDSAIESIGGKTSIVSRANLLGLGNTVESLVAKTNDLSAVKNHIIELPLVGTAGDGNSNFRASMAALTKNVGTAGDGSAANKAKKLVFIITDGIHDSVPMEPNVLIDKNPNHRMGPIDEKFCAQMKTGGAVVSVLYIPYIIPAGYEPYVVPYQDKVKPALEACASKGYFYNANSKSELTVALDKILNDAITSSLRITQ